MSVLASDLFNGSSLGANWTVDSNAFNEGSGVITIVTPTGVDGHARYTAITWPNDQWSEVTLGTSGSSVVGTGYGPDLRKTSATITEYRLVANTSGWEIAKEISGGFTSISNGSATTWANGDRVYAEIRGTTLIVKKNTTNGLGGTTIFSGTDSAIASGYSGIIYSGLDATSNVDSWQGGDFTSTSSRRPTKNSAIETQFHPSYRE